MGGSYKDSDCYKSKDLILGRGFCCSIYYTSHRGYEEIAYYNIPTATFWDFLSVSSVKHFGYWGL